MVDVAQGGAGLLCHQCLKAARGPITCVPGDIYLSNSLGTLADFSPCQFEKCQERLAGFCAFLFISLYSP